MIELTWNYSTNFIRKVEPIRKGEQIRDAVKNALPVLTKQLRLPPVETFQEFMEEYDRKKVRDYLGNGEFGQLEVFALSRVHASPIISWKKCQKR